MGPAPRPKRPFTACPITVVLDPGWTVLEPIMMPSLSPDMTCCVLLV